MQDLLIAGHPHSQPRHHVRLPENRQDQRRTEDGNDPRDSHPLPFLVVEGLACGVFIFLNEQSDEQLQHVGEREAAADEEDPLGRAKESRVRAEGVDSLYDSFVQKRFADVAVEKGHATDAEGAERECYF